MAEDPRATFLATRQDYIARERAASDKVDTVMLGGATGALALSLTFIEKIAPKPLPHTLWMLAWAWGALLMALAAALITYELRSHAYVLARRQLDASQDPATINWRPVDKCNTVLFWLKITSLSALFIGIALLVVFAYYNVKLS